MNVRLKEVVIAVRNVHMATAEDAVRLLAKNFRLKFRGISLELNMAKAISNVKYIKARLMAAPITPINLVKKKAVISSAVVARVA